MAMLGWLDSLGGMILYIVIYTIIFSVFLFYAEKLMFIIPEANCKIPKHIPIYRPWGPEVINNFGKIIPLFKDMFAQLEDFFDRTCKKSGLINCDHLI